MNLVSQLGRPVVPLLVAVATAVFAACGDSPEIAYQDLLSDDPQVRADAAERLGEARSVDAVDSLIAVVDDPDEAVRVTAIRSLGKIGDARAVPAIARHVDDPLSTVRIAVCQALAWIGDESGIDPLRKLLYDPDDNVRLIAARHLGQIPYPRAIETLVEIALRDEDEMVRQHVIKVIGSREARDSVPVVEEALAAEADIVRANAAHVLGKIGDRSSVPTLVAALDDPYYKVRSLSAHSMIDILGDEADADLLDVLEEKLETEQHGMVRVDLAWSLARAGRRDHMPVIRDLLFTGDPEDVRAQAAAALGDVGEPSDVEVLERALDDKKGLVQWEAEQSIQKLKEA